jgi:hypothetical protein
MKFGLNKNLIFEDFKLRDKRWCGRGDLNPHTRKALPPQNADSAEQTPTGL